MYCLSIAKTVDITHFLLKSYKQPVPKVQNPLNAGFGLFSLHGARREQIFVGVYILSSTVKAINKGAMNMENNKFGQELAKQTLDQIPQANSNAMRIVGLVKEGGRITGYQLSDNSVVEKQQAVNMAKQGQIAGVGIAHRGDTEYLKSIPNGNENDNLGNLPSVSPNAQG